MTIEVKMATIRELREAQELSQMELAIKARMSITTISRIENGHPVSRNVLERLCDVLGTDPKTIIGVTIKRTYRRA